MERIQGLDWKIGFGSVNNEELFLEILETYCEEAQEILERYRNFQGEDMERAIVDMHGMKSASAGIGAMEISEEFKSMEVEGKTGNTEYLKDHMSECMLHLGELSGHIKEYLDTHQEKETVEQNNQPEETLDIEILNMLIQALDDIEFELFEEKIEQLLKKNFGSEGNEALKKAENAYENFEYDDAKEVLEALRERL